MNQEIRFTFSFTGSHANEIMEAFAAHFWDGGLDQHLEQDFLEPHGFDCDDFEFIALNHVRVNTDHASDRKTEKNRETEEGAEFIFGFSGKQAEKIGGAFVGYFWDGGFDQYLEQDFLAQYGMSCDDFEFIALNHVRVNTDHAIL